MSALEFDIRGVGGNGSATVVLSIDNHHLTLYMLDRREILELVRTLQQASVDLLDYDEVPT